MAPQKAKQISISSELLHNERQSVGWNIHYGNRAYRMSIYQLHKFVFWTFLDAKRCH